MALIGSRQQLEWVGDEGYGGSSAPPTQGTSAHDNLFQDCGEGVSTAKGASNKAHQGANDTTLGPPHAPHVHLHPSPLSSHASLTPPSPPHTRTRAQTHMERKHCRNWGWSFIKRTGGRFSKKADRPSMPSGDARWSASRRAVSAIKSPVMSCSKAYAPPPSSEAQGAKAGNTAGRARAVYHPPAQPRRE